jgi:cell division protein FtsB
VSAKKSIGERLPGLIGVPQVLLVVSLAIGLAVIVDFNRRLANAQRLVNDATQLANEVATLQAQREILLTARAYANSDQAVEDWARSQGKLIQPGEVIVVPLPPGGVTPTPVPPPLPTPVEVPNHDLWWSLFFDKLPEP